MSVFFPLCCALFFRRRLMLQPSVKKISLDILVPAHNESDTIRPTLESIRRSVDQNPIPTEASFFVAADSCNDTTPEIAKAFGAQVELVSFKSKWLSLNHLVKKSNADWVALVDCGALWPATLLTAMSSYWENPTILGIAPSYLPSRSKLLTRILWRFEKKMKHLESVSVGPVSVHGATVFYRRKALLAALSILQTQNWLNDDVVIPMTLQSMAEGKIIYLENAISDIGHLKKANEFVRRQRMTLGNIQWIKLLLPKLREKNIPAFLLAQRRLFRVFWIYWVSMLLIGVSSYGIIPLLLLLLLFREAAVASLLAPYLLASFKMDRLARWS